jgi:hypothetical protein
VFFLIKNWGGEYSPSDQKKKKKKTNKTAGGKGGLKKALRIFNENLAHIRQI